MNNVTELELKQHVGKSEEQLIQTAFSKLKLQLEPDSKLFDTILLKMNEGDLNKTLPKSPITVVINDIVLTKQASASTVNVTPSPYARYINRFSSKAIIRSVGGVCVAVLVMGSVYGIHIYQKKVGTTGSNQVATDTGNTQNPATIDSLLTEEDPSLDNELALMDSDMFDSNRILALVQSDTASFTDYNQELY